MSIQIRNKPGSLEALAEVIASTVKGVRPLRSIDTGDRPPRIFDSITRECMLRRIRWLRRYYPVGLLIDQATFNRAGLDALNDRDIARLLETLERARECMAEGISFEDAGLILDQRTSIEPDWIA